MFRFLLPVVGLLLAGCAAHLPQAQPSRVLSYARRDFALVTATAAERDAARYTAETTRIVEIFPSDMGLIACVTRSQPYVGPSQATTYAAGTIGPYEELHVLPGPAGSAAPIVGRSPAGEPVFVVTDDGYSGAVCDSNGLVYTAPPR